MRILLLALKLQFVNVVAIFHTNTGIESALIFHGELLEVIMRSKTICAIKVSAKVMIMVSTSYVV